MRAKDDAMVEQVASAIAIEDTGVPWHDVSPRDRAYYVRLARAALAAQPAPSAPVGVLAQRIEAYHWDIADKPVAAQFAAELRSLAAQPAASPQPPAEAQPVAWHTEDHLADKSATTYDPVVRDRWIAKGWPVTPLYAQPGGVK